MAGDANVARQPGCPGQDDLDAFAHGQLPPDRLEVIAEHISSCVVCELNLESLQASDTILMHLRRQPAPALLADEAAYGPLEERARAIPLEHPATATATDGGSADSATDEVEGPRLPMAFGGYQLLARLGHGAMGIVYLARQKALKRLVALKLVRAGIYASPEERLRFRREGEAIARVQHAHVVQIHEFGEYHGQLFFSMELLEGDTLTRKLNGKPQPEREAAELVRTLARAVHAAHQRGVVHRDLKPGNVLFASDGTVKITDFGLAKMLDTDSSDTRSDAILGTPAYMAPEQARGEVRQVGPAADVYALGAILYEALTGQPPFRAETRYQTLEWVRSAPVRAPSRLRRGLARGLEAICLKCLEKAPAERYDSAEALAQDLDRWLSGEPVLAWPRSWLVRSWRAGRRHRRLAGRLVLAATLLVLFALAWRGLSFSVPPEERESPEQRQALEIKLAQMRKGEPVTLIGETGPPVWWRWQPSRGEARTMLDLNQVFRVYAGKEPALLELLPQTPRRFRFRARVQHCASRPLGIVGIYFGHGTCRTEEGVTHCFFREAFNDQAGFRATGEAPWSEVRLLLPVYREQQRVFVRNPMNMTSSLSQSFVPTGAEGPTPWRRLEVEVTPERIKAYWEGKLIVNPGPRKPVDSCDPKEVLEWACRLMGAKSIVYRKAEDGSSSSREPLVSDAELALGGGLGLYVENGTAAFQSVEIEPSSSP
jgi:serine/threonine-protein kinase